MNYHPADLRPGDFVSLSGYDYELMSIDRADDFYTLYIERRDTRRRAMLVIHSSIPITRID